MWISTGDGTGSKAFQGDKFADESFDLQHYGPGWLSMVNTGPNTNGSQFFITLAKAPWLDGKHVVFGKVVDGWDVVRRLEATLTDKKQRPLSVITISDSGSLPTEPYTVGKYWCVAPWRFFALSSHISAIIVNFAWCCIQIEGCRIVNEVII